jgi:hypothetical protein
VIALPRHRPQSRLTVACRRMGGHDDRLRRNQQKEARWGGPRAQRQGTGEKLQRRAAR